jgi:hypothetical protein
VVVLVAAALAVFVWRVAAIERRRAWVVTRRADRVTAVAVTVALLSVVWIELLHRGSTGVVWVEVVLVGSVLATFVARYLAMFHAGRVVLSLGLDFAKFCAAVALLTSSLLAIAVDRLWSIAPFGALLVGIVSAFLPLYAIAEVLREGLESRPHERRAH